MEERAVSSPSAQGPYLEDDLARWQYVARMPDVLLTRGALAGYPRFALRRWMEAVLLTHIDDVEEAFARQSWPIRCSTTLTRCGRMA